MTEEICSGCDPRMAEHSTVSECSNCREDKPMKAHIENLTPFKTKIKILLIKFAVAIPFAAIVADRVAHAFGICLGVH